MFLLLLLLCVCVCQSLDNRKLTRSPNATQLKQLNRFRSAGAAVRGDLRPHAAPPCGRTIFSLTCTCAEVLIPIASKVLKVDNWRTVHTQANMETPLRKTPSGKQTHDLHCSTVSATAMVYQAKSLPFTCCSNCNVLWRIIKVKCNKCR